jgi:L-alanine-DL-glutamate epimerase-like enolase superfamily enzyme
MAGADLIDRIRKMEVKAYPIALPAEEQDGTLSWNKTTLVLVQIHSAGHCGICFTYANSATATLIHEELIPVITGQSAFDIPNIGGLMVQAIRNWGRPGVASMAISAVDTALWDLKAKILGISILDLLGGFREEVPVYGSGGFTNLSEKQLTEQITGWLELGISKFKIKIGRDRKRDLERVKKVRELIGISRELFVDANGAYQVKQALEMSGRLKEFDVRWFEEPVSSDCLEGLRYIRERLDPEMELSAGEYGYRLKDFKDIFEAQAVDVLQADLTRCGGYSGFVRVAALARAWMHPLSSHCAPTLHASLGCALSEVRHLEYFSDHVRIEQNFFDGAPLVKNGAIKVDRSRPGIGITAKLKDLEKLAA